MKTNHAEQQYQDWGTPWTEYHDTDRDALLAYCEAYLSGY